MSRARGELRSDLRRVARGWRWTRRTLPPAGAPPLGEPSAREFPTEWARGPLGRAGRAVVQRAGFEPLLAATVRRDVAGLDVLESLRPPVVFVANHASHLDTPLLLLALPAEWRSRTAVAAAADYFFADAWRAVGTALAFNTFPLERHVAGGGRRGATADVLLAEGWNVLMFPEGSRSPDGRLGTLRAGAAVLAVRHGLPVVPIAVRGTYAAMPRGRGWPVPGRPAVRVRLGPALRPASGEDPAALTGRIEAGLRRLLAEDTTTWWRAQTPGPAPDRDLPAPPGGWRVRWQNAEALRPAATLGADGRPLARPWD